MLSKITKVGVTFVVSSALYLFYQMLKVYSLTNNPFSENTIVVACDETREAALFDPGMSTPGECQALESLIARYDLTVKHLLLTHAHIDHVLGLPFAQARFGLTPRVHALEREDYDGAPARAQMFGVRCGTLPPADFDLQPGERIVVGKGHLRAAFTPGHSAGSVVFIYEGEGVTPFVVGGDVLFSGSIGRTDLPGGNFATLVKSIREVLYVLPNETVVWPGHGQTTTIADERASNPFVRDEGK